MKNPNRNWGGLRYDTDGCKRSDGTFDYNKLLATIAANFHAASERSEMIFASDDLHPEQGRYSESFQYGCPVLSSQRSYTLQAVSCHTMRWLDLIQEKHIALRALRAADDSSSWKQYLQERERHPFTMPANIARFRDKS